MLSEEKIVELLKACPQEDHTQEGWVWKQRIAWARAIEAAVLAEQAKAKPVAYRAKVGGNYVYAPQFTDASAEPLYLHPSPAPEGMVLVPIACLRSLQSSINGNCYMGQEWEIAQINAMIDASDKEYGK